MNPDKLAGVVIKASWQRLQCVMDRAVAMHTSPAVLFACAMEVSRARALVILGY